MLFTSARFSETAGGCYTGAAGDLRKGLEQPAEGRVPSTAYRRPQLGGISWNGTSR